MKSILFSIVFTTATIVGFSQEFGKADIDFSITTGVAFDNAEAGFAAKHTYNPASIYENNFTFIEIGFSSVDYESLDSSYFKTGGAMTFKYFYPIRSSDTSNSRYSGNLFGFDVVGLNLLPTVKFVDFLVTGGMNMGSKKVRIDRNIKYKNFIFAPRITSEIRFRIGPKFSITGRIEKQWDLTNPRWKLKKGLDTLDLTEFKYSPILVSAGLGWKIM